MGMYQKRIIESYSKQPDYSTITANMYRYRINTELRAKISKKLATKSLQELHEIVQQLMSAEEITLA